MLNVRDVPKPYKAILKPAVSWFGSWFGSSTYKIYFEDTAIREVTANRELVDHAVFLLNAAYLNGFMSGYICGEMEDKKIVPKAVA